MQLDATDNEGTADRPPHAKLKMPIDPSNQAVKDALKEGLKEWLDGMFAEFGKWTVRSLLVLAFVGAVYLALAGAGWKHP
jgi:hypothetical protein